VLDHSASQFSDAVLTDIDCTIHVVQYGVVAATIRGRGKIMEADDYRRVRGAKALIAGRLSAAAV
jgi:hypothetical protein